MAISVYLELTDEGGSPIEGSNPKTDARATMMECVEMNHRLYLPVDPVDGRITGNRRHEPVRVAKVTDKATPILFEKCAQGATLKDAKFHFYHITPEGNEVEYYTVTLTNCKIIDVSPRMMNTRAKEYEIFPHVEDVAFNYEKINWAFLDGNIESEDSYQTPK